MGRPAHFGSRLALAVSLILVVAAVVAVAVALGVGGGGGGHSRPPQLGVVQTFDGDQPDALNSAALTSSGADVNEVSLQRGVLSFHARPTNTGSDLRMVVWPARVKPVADEISCARWTKRNGSIVQLGGALRIRPDHDRLRAITVTQNVFGYPSVFNVHVWDTAKAKPLRTVGRLDFGAELERHGVVPSYFCLRAVGDRVDVKMWATGEPEPSWTDSRRVRTTMLPPGWEAPGFTGWYAGHLRAGDEAGMRDLVTWRYRSPAEAPGQK